MALYYYRKAFSMPKEIDNTLQGKTKKKKQSCQE